MKLRSLIAYREFKVVIRDQPSSGSQVVLDKNFLEDLAGGGGLSLSEWHLDTHQVVFDLQWYKMMGRPAEISPQHISVWRAFIHADDRENMERSMNSYLKGDSESYQCVYRLQHADRSWVWVLDRGRFSEWDRDGKPTRFTGLHLDISKFKQNEDLSRGIQRMAKIGGWTFDVRTQTPTWTDEIYRIHGLPIGTPMDMAKSLSFFPEYEHARINNCMARCMEGISYQETFEFRDATGKHKWIEALGQPTFDAQGVVYKIAGTFQDITERKQNEVALLNQRERHSRLIELVPSGIFETDKDGRCIFVNETWSRLAGLPFDQALDQGWVEAIHPDDRAKVFQEWEASVREEREFDLLYRFLHKDGIVHHVHGRTLAVVNSQGIVTGYLGSIQNMTDQKRAQEKLEETSQELDQFFNVALELLGIAGRDAKFKKLNPAFIQTLGYT
ncbi:MAG: PAS domain-containing protein, partial [Bdellovibrionales bacterium]|nr:PAS domain-containing protein [Bdellovibrionales bacterium]